MKKEINTKSACGVAVYTGRTDGLAYGDQWV